MNKQKNLSTHSFVTWKKFSSQHCAVFRSIGKEIRIGVLSFSTLLSANAGCFAAQSQEYENVTRENGLKLDDVVVTASFVPVALEKSARIVSVISAEQIKDAPVSTVNDLLKYVSGIDVRQRGAFGIQTDISINGGTHDQIVILLNGVNISSPHTGHLAADIPISTNDIERIEVLEGAASRVYGSSAFSGAINIITKSSYQNSINASLSGGSFGTFSGEAGANIGVKSTHHSLSAGYTRSDGGTPHSDFNRLRSFYQGGTTLPSADINWQLGMSRSNYGANTFYSDKYPDQYEENRRYMAALSAQTNGQIKFASTLYWNRTYDHYQLIRNTNTGENFHQCDVYGLKVSATTKWKLGTSAIGADVRNEGILSTNLGKPLDEKEYVKIPGHDGFYKMRDNRTNFCYYLEHNAIISNWTISTGFMANLNTGLDHRFRIYPGVDISYRPTQNIKLFASWNMAQRMPTFTDMYYKSPTRNGNIGLKPEKTNDCTIGGNFTTNSGFVGQIRAFYRAERNMIDWVMYPSDIENNFTTYHAANFDIDNIGFDVNTSLNFNQLLNRNSFLKSLSVNYSFIHQKRYDDTEIVASCYALDYLRHKFVARLDMNIWRYLNCSLSYRWQDRTGSFISNTKVTADDGTTSWEAHSTEYAPYGLLDAKLSWNAPKYELFIDANNITNRHYYDIGNVQQPGFWFMAGARIKINL